MLPPLVPWFDMPEKGSGQPEADHNVPLAFGCPATLAAQQQTSEYDNPLASQAPSGHREVRKPVEVPDNEQQLKQANEDAWL